MDDPAGSRTLSELRSLDIPSGLQASLVLLRHGESMAIVEGRFQGRLETPLSALGRRQAELAGVRLATPSIPPRIPVPGRPPVEVRHSPLGRATETAEAAAVALRRVHGPAAVPPISPDPGLVEIAQGAWEGLHRDEVIARYPAELEAWRVRPAEANAPGGESIPAAAQRVRDSLRATIDALAEAAPGAGSDRTSVGGYPAGHGSDTPWSLLVGHDGIFKVALLTLLDLPLERFWTFPWGLTGITVVEFVTGRAILRAHNLTGHLAPLQAGTPEPGAVEPGTAAAESRSEDEAAERERTGSL
ncbi:MAG: histidine phosphatase family protein [Candidatus Limnocylindrales bacterium]